MQAPHFLLQRRRMILQCRCLQSGVRTSARWRSVSPCSSSPRWFGGMRLPRRLSATYGIGPAAMPYVVAVALAALGLGHFVVAFRDGLPVPEHADGIAIGWIALGLVALMLCIAFGGGFILARPCCSPPPHARSGGARCWSIPPSGSASASLIYLLFSKLLTLSLPAGPLERLL